MRLTGIRGDEINVCDRRALRACLYVGIGMRSIPPMVSVMLKVVNPRQNYLKQVFGRI